MATDRVAMTPQELREIEERLTNIDAAHDVGDSLAQSAALDVFDAHAAEDIERLLAYVRHLEGELRIREQVGRLCLHRVPQRRT